MEVLKRCQVFYISAPGSTEACYEMVEDEGELQAVYAVFQQMLDDVNFEWRSDF